MSGAMPKGASRVFGTAGAWGRGTVVTVGTFDGVHRGHWAVLREITARAAATGRRSVLVTFDPHPLAVVRPAEAPRLLSTVQEKKEMLAQSGIDAVVFVHFTPAVAALSPGDFVQDVLIDRLGVAELVIGYDHGFGRDRSGDADTLRRIGGERGFEVDVLGPVAAGEAPISSSRIRQALDEGDVAFARAALGRPYAFTGRVVQGDGRGRSIGFPTANLAGIDPGKQLPAPGVYAVRVRSERGTFAGALHVGPRPTFEGASPSLEVHLLDFEGDLRGAELRVELIGFLRGVERFSGVDELRARIALDVERARDAVARDDVARDGSDQ